VSAMPKIDIAGIELDTRSGYPEPFRPVTIGRERKRLGNAIGLDQFGVNLSRLKPGAQSSQRHWHANEDEFVYILEGEVVLHEDSDETVLRPGDAAGWKAGVPNGHCLINRSAQDVVYLEIGTRAKHERAQYPDIDLMVVRDDNGMRYTHKSGEPYPKA
jgi:uncharacterized cupin superfamily protein